MAQPTENIGQSSPALDAVAAERAGWSDDHFEPFGAERTDQSDISFWDLRANRQIAGASGGTFAGAEAPFAMAGHVETPMAARDPGPRPVDEVRP